MTTNRLLTAIILGLALALILVSAIAWCANHKASEWQITVIELQQELLDMQQELEVYHIDDAKRQVHDERMWEDDMIEVPAEFLDSLKWYRIIVCDSAKSDSIKFKMILGDSAYVDSVMKSIEDSLNP